MHRSTHDPFTTELQNGSCINIEWNYPQCTYEGEETWIPTAGGYDYCRGTCLEYEQVSVFDPNTIFRGNVTKVTAYSDAAGASGAIAQTKRYDTTGNLVAESASCCELRNYDYTVATQYAYPTAQSSGSSDSNSTLRISSSGVYDFNTGLAKQSTDPNGRTSSITYNPANLRPIVSTSSTGAYSTTIYDESAMTVTEELREAGGAVAGKTVKHLNGLGLVRREDSIGPNNVVDIVETKYNKLAEVWKQSRPYRSGDTPAYSERFYDLQGRLFRMVEPDGSETRGFYNETQRPDAASSQPGSTVRVQDAWGRERWGRYDEQNRLVEVAEPNPDRAANPSASVFTPGSLVTTYSYNTLGRLKQVNQGTQVRRFAYDDLGRLTRQKLAEQTATLNDIGVFVGANQPDANWAEAFWYDYRSNLVQKTDARGVKTLLSYQVNGADDPLNRLHKRSFDTSGAPSGLTIASAPEVTYTYKTTGDQTRIETVRTAGVLTETYGYDAESRVSEYVQLLDNRPNQEIRFSYLYDTLDRVKEITYPAQFNLAGSPRKIVEQTYDTASRLTSLRYGTAASKIQQAGEIVYDAAGETTSIKIGPSGTNQVNEQYTFDPQTGLLTNQKAFQNGAALMDLSYEYRRRSGGSYVAGRTGQLTEMADNLDANKNRYYEYDPLGRLVKATGGVNRTWTQNYSFDRYGNRTSVTTAGNESLRPEIEESPSSTKMTDQKIGGSTPINSSRTGELVKDLNGVVESSGRVKGGPWADPAESARENSSNSGGISTGPGKTAAGAKEIDYKLFLANARSSAAGASDAATMPTVPPYTPFDFDGDSKADHSIWGRTSHNWTVQQSGSGGQPVTSQHGLNGDQIAPGDYDGDGKTDYAVWTPSTGTWTIKRSSNGTTTTAQWGGKGDSIVPADYDGDGKTDLAVWRPSTGVWYIIKSSDSAIYTITWGGQQFGDIPVVGDYDGDSKADIAVWRPSEGQWYVYQSSNGQVLQVLLGSEASRDVLVPADYDGDGKADPAAWRPSTGTWTVRRSTTGANATYQLGTSSDVAVPSAYIRRSSAPKGQSVQMKGDGWDALSYDQTSNRVTTTGFEYDVAGNQTKALGEDGIALKYIYDAANRVKGVLKETSPNVYVPVQSFEYGPTNTRLTAKDEETGVKTVYAGAHGTVLTEYTEYTQNLLTWTKSYTYLGDSQLATITPGGTTENIEYNHPDRLGTQLITNQTSGTKSEQAHLPFGRPLDSESTITDNNKRFTTYDRSARTGLDYAINRTYDSKQGRFTQVDPIGMSAASLAAPQSLNLYSYCGNDPVNFTDPSGLFVGKLFKWIGKAFSVVNKILKWVVIAVVAIAVVIAVVHSGGAALTFLHSILAPIGKFLGIKIAGTAGIITNIAAAKLGVSVGLAGKIAAGLYAVGAVSAFNDGGDDEDEVERVETRCPKNIRIETPECPSPWFTKGWWGRVNSGAEGFGNGLLFGIPRLIDRWRGIDRGADEDSPEYQIGWWTGTASSVVVGGAAGNAAKGALAARGGVRLGMSEYVMAVAKSNPSETSVGLILRGKRVLDIGRAEVIRGRGKMLHIRVGANGRHRTILGRIIK